MSGDPVDDVVSDFPFSNEDRPDERYVCEECDETFDTERGLNIHAGQVHHE